MSRPTCATCSHQPGAKSCGHLLAETGETVWCSTIAECDNHQARSVPLHVITLTSIARRGDRAAWTQYIDTVRSREGERTAQQLRAAFAAAWRPE